MKLSEIGGINLYRIVSVQNGSSPKIGCAVHLNTSNMPKVGPIATNVADESEAKNAYLTVCLRCDWVHVCRAVAVCLFKQRKLPSFKQRTSHEYLALMSAFQLQATV